MDSMLKAVLGTFNQEQSGFYPPRIFDTHFNAVTSFLISKLVELYPTDEWVLDMLDPFIEHKTLPVKGGVVTLPDNFRNFIGTPQINISSSGEGECGCDKKGPTIDTEREFQLLIEKGQCLKSPVILGPQSEFAERTKSVYDRPSYIDPIGYRDGKKRIVVCPADIGKMEVVYVREEKQYRYGYTLQPDDTFVWNPLTTEESEWSAAAFEPLYKGLCSLYAAYTRDGELMNWSALLNKEGIV